MTDAQMRRSLKALTRTFAWKALLEFVALQRTAIADQLLNTDLASPEALKLQGRPLGMSQLLIAIENLPDQPDED